jgi:hypothetical protein
MFFLLFACTADGSKVPEDTGTPYAHPIVPEAYRDAWDVDSITCEDVIYYWAFEGSISDTGAITGTESYYWFFSDEGAETDCKDSFSLAGQEESTPISDDPCISCDRDLTATLAMTEATCNWQGYEDLFDNDDEDRIEEEVYTVALMLDAFDGVSGELLDQLNTWGFFQDDVSSRSWIQRPISVGTYAPTGSDVRGAASLTWASDGICVNVTGG